MVFGRLHFAEWKSQSLNANVDRWTQKWTAAKRYKTFKAGKNCWILKKIML